MQYRDFFRRKIFQKSCLTFRKESNLRNQKKSLLALGGDFFRQLYEEPPSVFELGCIDIPDSIFFKRGEGFDNMRFIFVQSQCFQLTGDIFFSLPCLGALGKRKKDITSKLETLRL